MAPALLLLTAGCAAWNPDISGQDDPSKSFNFLAVGDWGDDSAGQHAAAAGMGMVAEEISATQVIALGDNFYHTADSHCGTAGGHYGGICLNNTDGIDGVIRFNSTFESVYTAESLRTIPFYAIAGNHDHAGNVSAQIAYTTNSQNLRLPHGRGLPAARWNFPDYWHNITQHVEIPGSGGKTVELEILLFDSCVRAGSSDVINEDGTVSELKLSQLPGPPNPATAAAQLQWLESRMAGSRADYLWIGGHYPVWAIGQDPPTGVNPVLRPLLNKWEAHYFNGHEHDLEHIVEVNSKVNYVSTGAGKYCCYHDTNLKTVPEGSIRFAASGAGGSEWWGRRPPAFELLSGFTSYRIGADSMRVYFHAHNVSTPCPPCSLRACVCVLSD